MKLGTETGSVMNHLASRMTIGQPEPVVGMGVTFLGWTDRDAGTVFRVFKQPGKAGLTIIECRDDEATLVSGSQASEDQGYEFKTKVNGNRSHWRREADGRWQRVSLNLMTKRWTKYGSKGLRIGERDCYRDPSF